MTEVATVTTEKSILQAQHQWSMVARDLAMFVRPQAGATPITVEEIACRYGLSLASLSELIHLPTFKKYLKIEIDRMNSLGPTAGYILHAELITTAMDEEIFKRALNGGMDVSEMLKFRNAMAKSAGLDAPVQAKEETMVAGVAVNVNLNVPQLDNPKLAHMFVKDVTPAEDEQW